MAPTVDGEDDITTAALYQKSQRSRPPSNSRTRRLSATLDPDTILNSSPLLALATPLADAKELPYIPQPVPLPLARLLAPLHTSDPSILSTMPNFDMPVLQTRAGPLPVTLPPSSSGCEGLKPAPQSKSKIPKVVSSPKGAIIKIHKSNSSVV